MTIAKSKFRQLFRFSNFYGFLPLFCYSQFLLIWARWQDTAILWKNTNFKSKRTSFWKLINRRIESPELMRQRDPSGRSNRVHPSLLCHIWMQPECCSILFSLSCILGQSKLYRLKQRVVMFVNKITRFVNNCWNSWKESRVKVLPIQHHQEPSLPLPTDWVYYYMYED